MLRPPLATGPASPESAAMLSTLAFSQRARQAGGQPISQLMAQALANPHLVSLAAGFVDQATLPVEATAEAMTALLADADLARAALQYGTTAGHVPLRERLIERQLAADGQPPSERRLSVKQTVVTAGSNELLHMLADTLCDPGDIVLCAAPSYFVFLGALANLGVRSVGVESDDQGLVPEALEQELSRREWSGELARVKAIYVTTYFDNPSTATLSLARRPAIVEIAKRWSRPGQTIHVIEDAAYRELRYAGDDLPSLRTFDEEGDTVILTHTFSKSFSPGVRLGWGILPPALVEPVLAQKGNIDFGTCNLTQHLMSQVLELGLLEPHIERLRAGYREKLAAMLRAADAHLAHLPGVRWTRPTGGLYVWLTAPEGLDTGPNGPLFQRAVEEGMLYVPGRFCYAAEGVAATDNQMRLSFGVQTPARIEQGIAALGRAIEQCAR
jgi:2-aminoadipate transaminase